MKLSDYIKTLPKRFKSKYFNQTYWGYLSIRDPENVGRGGNCDVAFYHGYHGKPYMKVPHQSMVWAAHCAGKDWKKKHEKFFNEFYENQIK